VRLKNLYELCTILVGLESSQVDLAGAEDTRGPSLWEHDLDTRRYIWLELGLDASLLEIPLKSHSGNTEGICKRSGVVHEKNTAFNMFVPAALFYA
jgi:hypothetical protein